MRVLILFIVLLSSVSASAYKPDLHAKLTIAAFDALNSCLGKNIYSVSTAKFVAQKNHAEDNVTPERLANWHFYAPEHRHVKSVGLMKKTLHDLFDKKEAAMLTAENKKALAGSLLHYIQDVSVPAHVVPVFHGFDAFDGYPIFVNKFLKEAKTLCSEFKTLKGKYFSPSDMLDAVALNTKESLNEEFILFVNGNPETRVWAIFWPKKNQNKLFGEYSKDLGNSFGKIKSFSCGRRDKNTCKVSSKSYDTFAYERQKQAVLFSMLLIEKYL